VSLHGGLDEGSDNIYGVSNLLEAMAWRIRFPDDDIEAEMVPLS
jgi:hypothetical protein